MYSEIVSSPMCTDLPSTGVKPGYQINAQISQIPGLSQIIMPPPDEKARGRRSGVLNSDSEFVKLSKQGGHKGLLWQEEIMTINKSKPYIPPGWFCTAPGHEPSEEEKTPGAFQAAEPPFGTDNMSAWERDDSSSNGKEKNNKVHYIPTARETEKPQPSIQYHEKNQFKRIIHGKNTSPVDMSKLLSFGYAEDDKPTDNMDLSN